MTSFNNVSIYIIGTELTRGIIGDKHIKTITTELTALDYNVKRAVIVPDDGVILKDLEYGVQDSDVLIVTGGLGPTTDDMTRQAIATVANVPLEKNQAAWDEVYSRLGERIYGANEKQAYIPRGFEKISNPKGTAPGFKGIFNYRNKEVLVIAMPGPPAEMQPMFYNYVLPYLSTLKGKGNEKRDEFSVFLTPEAKLEELCAQCAKDLGFDQIQWGTRFQQFRISLYISGGTKEQREIYENHLSATIGKDLVVPGDVEAIDLLENYLLDNHMTISCAESCTGGLISKLLTDKSGSSSWFWGGVTTYANEAKTSVLGVPENILSDPNLGPVSHPCAIKMAEGMRSLSETCFSLSTTGIAGPTGALENKAVGTVYFGFSSSHRESQSIRLNFVSINRDSVRRRAAVAAFILGKAYIQGRDVVDISSSWVYI
ncbi:MAG: nicotinamide-nucleotide amidohydrolase family protein [Sphaerochaetaceae bacterium]|nr:nicotinamide-nucleotide amidohydrolase family protein [Sphaerochaetaceae bacterium]